MAIGAAAVDAYDLNQNQQISGSGQVNNSNSSPNGGVNKRRHLPIEQKKKVFNEWGAVLRHQDEVEQKQRADQAA